MTIFAQMKQRIAIVMGATSGIGREVALLLAQKGWTVGVAGRRKEKLDELLKVEGILAAKQIDVTQPDAPALLQELIDEMGGMQLYFHSSGIGYQNYMLDTDKEMRTVETNGMGFTRMVNAAFQYFTQHQGHIACISSIAGTKGLGAAPAYSATKRFQNHYLECLTQLANMRHIPVKITDIRPGFVATDLIKDGSYPMQLTAPQVAREIVEGLEKGKSIITVDWKYRILVFFWRLIPRFLWIRLKIKTK